MAESIEQRIRNIGKNKNNSLMNYIEYRVLFNQGKRTLKGNIKVYFMDLKIKVWCKFSGVTVTYQKEDSYTRTMGLLK